MLISSLFTPGKTALSFEFFPPKNDVAEEQLIATYDSLRQFQPDFVSVTYGAGGSTRDRSLAVSKDLNERRHCAVMAHLTCLSHDEEELGVIADQLWDSGIVNIMALRGDPPRNPDQTPLKQGCFSYSGELIAFLRKRHDFCCGGGCYPEGHAETPDIAIGIEHLKHKIEAGCEFLHRGQNLHAFRAVRLSFFVAHGPQKDAGTIAVAAHQIGKLAHPLRV